MKQVTPPTIGQRFGSWTVIGAADKRWLTRCDCGRESSHLPYTLTSGKTLQCLGCAARKTRSTHGERRANGYRGSPEYRAWSFIHQRVGKQKYYEHVRVCDRWSGKNGYENFLADMGRMPAPRCEADRIENTGHYEPGNVRWATRTEQMQNTRRTVLLTCDGETHCISEWARRTGISKFAIQKRKASGWTDERCLKQPLRAY
jgi:hypothetical protein